MINSKKDGVNRFLNGELEKLSCRVLRCHGPSDRFHYKLTALLGLLQEFKDQHNNLSFNDNRAGNCRHNELIEIYGEIILISQIFYPMTYLQRKI